MDVASGVDSHKESLAQRRSPLDNIEGHTPGLLEVGKAGFEPATSASRKE